MNSDFENYMWYVKHYSLVGIAYPIFYEDVVYCKDPKQQKLYLKHHAELADIFIVIWMIESYLCFGRMELKNFIKNGNS